jgi:hypothetical protein
VRNSDRAWVALASGVAAYDLIATEDEQLTNAARRYFQSQPIATTSMILVTGLHLLGGIPPWCDPITLTFAAYRRLLRGPWRQKAEQPVADLSPQAVPHRAPARRRIRLSCNPSRARRAMREPTSITSGEHCRRQSASLQIASDAR